MIQNSEKKEEKERKKESFGEEFSHKTLIEWNLPDEIAILINQVQNRNI